MKPIAAVLRPYGYGPRNEMGIGGKVIICTDAVVLGGFGNNCVKQVPAKHARRHRNDKPSGALAVHMVDRRGSGAADNDFILADNSMRVRSDRLDDLTGIGTAALDESVKSGLKQLTFFVNLKGVRSRQSRRK